MRLKTRTAIFCLNLPLALLAVFLVPAPSQAGEESGQSGGTAAVRAGGALPAPAILQPVERAEIRGIEAVDFVWAPLAGAAHYHFLLARDRAFEIPVEDAVTAGTSLVVSYLDYGTYFFKVSSVDEQGREGAFSERVSFILVPPPPMPVGRE